MNLLENSRECYLNRKKGHKPFKIANLFLILSLTFLFFEGKSQGFLKAEGKYIVNEKGEKVLLRGMGLGGWMLQEGYMLRFPNEGQQHRIKARIEEVIGKEKTQEFYDAWLANHARKIDIDSMKSWGFNSVRLAMHYNLYTLPIEEEPVKGENTWLEKGFAMTDSLLSWCKANNMYLILDLHAAPGGQGNDFNISDRDPNKPSLWDSEENQNKMIALWTKLAERYVDEPWIAAYDLINEPNWGFVDPNDKHGLNEPKNEPLKKLLVACTEAIRKIDKKHIIIIEGNGWGNNYNGMLPTWDDNMVLSFHKYWNHNNQGAIQNFLDKREKYNVPIWLGETGENSNVWFTEAIILMEKNEIGWAWWPLKKLGFNNPLEINLPEGYQELLNYWKGEGPKPSSDAAYKTMMQLAENTKLENCFYHKDVIDAMFRQIRSDKAIPFKNHTVNDKIYAVDFDLGKHGVAYNDKDTADYHISMGGDWVAWNKGRVYRNDGVDIQLCNDSETNGYAVAAESGEWLQYSINVPKNGTYNLKIRSASADDNGKITLITDGNELVKDFSLSNTGSNNTWKTQEVKGVRLKKGLNIVKVQFTGNPSINYLQFSAK